MSEGINPVRFRVHPDPERDTGPRDTYAAIDGDSYDVIVGGVTHAEASFIAAVLNGEVAADDLRAEAWDEGFVAGVNTDMGDWEHPPDEYINPYREGNTHD